MAEPLIEQLARDVSYLRDRQDILDCVHRYARGIDRHDTALVSQVYHSWGTDEHGDAVNGGGELAQWANDRHAAYLCHLHNVTTHSCTIDGDRASAETYVLFGLPFRDEPRVRLGGARYLDRLERAGGLWRITHRQCLIEWMMTAQSDIEEFRARGFPSGSHDGSDPSYALFGTTPQPASHDA